MAIQTRKNDYVYAGSVVGNMDGGLIEASYGGGVISVQGTVRHKYVGGIVGKKPSSDSAVKNSYGVTDSASAYRLCEASATNSACYDESLAAWKKTIDQLRTPTAYGTANTDIYKDWNIDTALDLTRTRYLEIPTYNSANADDIWNFGTNIQAPVHGAKAGADPATQRANVNITQPSTDITIYESAAGGTATADIILSINYAQRSPTFIMLAGDRDAYHFGTDQDNKRMEIPANSTAEHTFTLKAIDDKINQPGANRTVIRLRDIALPADMIGGTIPNVTITIKDDDLSPPTGVALSQLNNSRNMRIDWTAPTDPAPDSYIVKWNNQNGGWNSPLGTATPTANTYTVNNLTIGTTYYARVQAVKTEHENSAHGASAGMMLGNDYDTDDDGLIEISQPSPAKRHALGLGRRRQIRQRGLRNRLPQRRPQHGLPRLPDQPRQPRLRGLRTPRQPRLQHQRQRQERRQPRRRRLRRYLLEQRRRLGTHRRNGRQRLHRRLRRQQRHGRIRRRRTLHHLQPVHKPNDGQLRGLVRLPERRQRQAGSRRRPYKRRRLSQALYLQRRLRRRLGGQGRGWRRLDRRRPLHRQSPAPASPRPTA